MTLYGPSRLRVNDDVDDVLLLLLLLLLLVHAQYNCVLTFIILVSDYGVILRLK